MYSNNQDVVGPKMSTAAITTSFGEVMDKLYTQDLFNISAVQIFIRKLYLANNSLY